MKTSSVDWRNLFPVAAPRMSFAERLAFWLPDSYTSSVDLDRFPVSRQETGDEEGKRCKSVAGPLL